MISRCLFFIYRTWVVRVGGMVGGSVDQGGAVSRQDILGGQVTPGDVFMQSCSGRVWSRLYLRI